MKLQRFFLIIIFITSSFVALSQGIPLGGYFDVLVGNPIDSRLVKDDIIGANGRNAILPGIRYQGLTVYVKSTGKNYQLVGGITNSDWVEIGGGSSSLIPGLGIYFLQDTINAYIDSPFWNANKLRGNNISSIAPSDGQVLSWDNTNSYWSPSSVQGSLIASTGISISNDSISALNNSIMWNADRLVGYDISTSVLPVFNNYVLGWDSNNSVWKPSPIISGSYIPPVYTASTGLTLTGATFSAQTTNALWNANQLQGNDISLASPTDGQVLTWDISNTIWKAGDVQGSLIASTGISISNDSIRALNNSIMWNADRLAGYDISTSVPPVFNNYVLSWDSNNSVWKPSPIISGGYIPPVYTAGTGLTLTGSTFSGQTSQPLWNANQLQGKDISTIAPSDGQTLTWDNTNSLWKASNIQGSLVASTGISITSNTISALNTSNIWNADQLMGIGITSNTPILGEILFYNGTKWAPSSLNLSLLGGNGIETMPIGGQTVIQVDYNTGLDISGGELIARTTEALWNANQLQGTNISTSAPLTGQLLSFDGSNWTPMDVTTLLTDGDGIIIADDTIKIDYATGLDISGGKLVARTSEALWNANQLQSVGISNTAPVSGQLLTFNGTNWTPDNASNLLTGGEGIDITNDTVSVDYGNGLKIIANQLLADISNGLAFNGSSIETDLGQGLEFDASSIRVDLGNGLLFNGNSVQSDLGTGLEFDANKIRADIGDGLTINVNDIVVDYSTGLNITAGQLVARTTEALWNANQLQGVGISTSVPLTGQLLSYNGTNWTPDNASSLLTGGDGIDITNDTVSVDYSTGLDISAGQLVARTTEGLWNANQLQSTVISTTTPINGQILTFDGTSWKPDNASNILTGGDGIDITNDTISVDYSTGLDISAGQLVARTSEAIWNANQLQSTGISSTAPTNGQILSYDGSNWIPVDAAAGLTGGNGIDITSNTIIVDLNTNSGLEFSGAGTDKLQVNAYNGLLSDGNGLSVLADIGISVTATGVGVKEYNGIIVDANGVSVNPDNGINVTATGVSIKSYDGIMADGNGVSVDLDATGSGLEFSGTNPNRTLGIADLGVTNAMLAGSIVNAKLVNSSINMGDGVTNEDISLGGAVTITGSGNASVAYSIATNTFTISSTNALLTNGDGLTGSDYDGSTAQTWAVDYGTGVNQAVEGNQTGTITAGNGLTGGITNDPLGDGFTTSLSVDYVNTSGLTITGGQLDIDESVFDQFIDDDVADNYVPYKNGISNKLVASNMYFDGTNIGIGTTSPNVTLEVNGQIRTTILRESSDVRFKENIETINNALEKTIALRGVNYNWKEDFAKSYNLEEKERLGLIAQEVEKIVPQVVSTDDNGYKSICYSSLTGLLIEAVKEQNELINNQSITIEGQQNQIKEQNIKIEILFDLLEKEGIIAK